MRYEAEYIIDVTNVGEEVDSRTISDRLREKGIELSSQAIGATLSWHLSHRFSKIKREGMTALFRRNS